MNRRRTFGAAMGVIGLAWVAYGCGGNSGGMGGGTATSVPAERSYRGTQAPGDVWSYTVGESTFSATNSTLHHDYAGTVRSLPSGFKKLTMTSSTDESVHVGDVSYTVEIPETALVVKPVNGAAVVACGLGDQPTGSSLKYNWIALPEPGWTLDDSPAYGTAEFAIAGTSFTGTITSYHADDSLKKSFEDGFDYSRGSLLQPENTDMTGAMTPSGTFMLDHGPQRGGAIGVLQPSANLDKNEITSHEFIGVLTKGSRSECFYGKGMSDGSFTGETYADVETGTIVPGENPDDRLRLGEQFRPGLFRATIDTDEGAVPFVVAVNKAKGKWVLYGFGTDGGAYNVMIVQK